MNEPPPRIRIRAPKIKPPSVKQLRNARDRVIAVLKKLSFTNKKKPTTLTTTTMLPYNTRVVTKKKSFRTKKRFFTAAPNLKNTIGTTPVTRKTISTTSFSLENAPKTTNPPEAVRLKTPIPTRFITPSSPLRITTEIFLQRTSQCPNCKTTQRPRKLRKPRRQALDLVKTVGKKDFLFSFLEQYNKFSTKSCVNFTLK